VVRRDLDNTKRRVGETEDSRVRHFGKDGSFTVFNCTDGISDPTVFCTVRNDISKISIGLYKECDKVR